MNASPERGPTAAFVDLKLPSQAFHPEAAAIGADASAMERPSARHTAV